MRLKRIIPAIALVGVMAIPAAANASVQFDSSSGLGFVGKGDIQTPFGWNDQKLQQNAKDISFTYDSTKDDAYEITCEWDTGNDKKIVHHVQHKSGSVNDTVAYDVAKKDRNNPNGKVTGFNLTGMTQTASDSEGDVPVVGAPCPVSEGDDNNSIDKRITAVELVSSTSEEKLMGHDNVTDQHTVLNWPEVAPIA
jgi:hypothetical protein